MTIHFDLNQEEFLESKKRPRNMLMNVYYCLKTREEIVLFASSAKYTLNNMRS